MDPNTKEPAKETARSNSRTRFDPKKELRLTGLTHQFLSRAQTQHWSLLFEKLSLLQSSYKGELALKLCRKCLCFYNCKLGAKHEDTTINSLFKDIDFEQGTVSDLLELLREQGKTIRDSEGEQLIGFPGFNLECGDDYYFAPGAKPAQVQLSQSTIETISFISKTNSKEGGLQKRQPSLSLSNMKKDAITPKKRSNNETTSGQVLWRIPSKNVELKMPEYSPKSAKKKVDKKANRSVI